MFRDSSRARSLLAALAAAAFLAAAVSPAYAEITEQACSDAKGFRCGEVPVPIDRSGAVPGTIRLNVVRKLSSANPERLAVIALAGGPGQAAAPLAADFAEGLAAALPTRDLLVFDQRGTGRSNPLSCGALSEDSNASVVTLTGRCAGQLGVGRQFYTTNDSALDIEALRIAGGYEKLTLYGVSYGTKVAETYAARFPDRVERLILDSVVTPEGPDPLQRSTFAAIPRILRELCAARECAGITSDATADLRALVRRLQQGDLTGRFVTAGGQGLRARFSRDDILGLLIDGDLNPSLRAEFPAAVASARRGDRAALTRLIARVNGATARGVRVARQDDSSGVNDALFTATTCEEMPFPWTRAATPQNRLGEFNAAVDATDPATFFPFDRTTAKSTSLASVCAGWPTPGAAPTVISALPAVPTLVLNGRADLRTPLEDAEAVAARITGSQTAAVPFSGHSVLGGEFSDEACAARAVTQFFANQAVSPCINTDNPFSPVSRAPTSLLATPPVAGRKGRLGRTIAAALATARDMRRQVLGFTLDNGDLPSTVGGLRGGRSSVRASGTQRLRNVEYVPGVRVSGTVTIDGSAANLTVRGGGALRGRVRLVGGGTVIRATLGGRSVRLVAAEGAGLTGEADLVTLASALRFGRLTRGM